MSTRNEKRLMVLANKQRRAASKPALPRRSVPTEDLQQWYDIGWSYIRPDFDTPNHSLIEWLSTSTPRVPAAHRVPESKENAVAE